MNNFNHNGTFRRVGTRRWSWSYRKRRVQYTVGSTRNIAQQRTAPSPGNAMFSSMRGRGNILKNSLNIIVTKWRHFQPSHSYLPPSVRVLINSTEEERWRNSLNQMWLSRQQIKLSNIQAEIYARCCLMQTKYISTPLIIHRTKLSILISTDNISNLLWYRSR